MKHFFAIIQHIQSLFIHQIKKRILRSLLLLPIFFAACELVTEIDLDIENSDSFIVMHGFISAEYGVDVLVKRTVPVNTPTVSDVIHDPTVWLYANNKPLKALLKLSDYHYRISPDSLNFSNNQQYSIQVEASGMETAISKQQTLMQKGFIDSAYFSQDSNFVYYEFYDDPNVNNYYSMKINFYSNGSTNDFDSTNIVPNHVGNDDNYHGKVIRYFEVPLNDFDSVCINRYAVSVDYFNFMDSYFDFELSYEDYNYETVYPVVSQVSNGFGFFVSYELSTYVLRNKNK